MYERFTDRARQVLSLANEEARRFNHEYVGTEHILLGLVREETGVGANVLKSLGVDLPKVHLEIEKIVQAGPDIVTMGKRSQTPRAKKVIEYAIEESRNLNHNYVGTEHLLLGLLREVEGVASQVLMNLGLALTTVRGEVFEILGYPRSEGFDPGVEAPDKFRPSYAELHNLPDQTVRALIELDHQIQQIAQQKEEALAASDFARALVLRARADQLKKQRAGLLGEQGPANGM